MKLKRETIEGSLESLLEDARLDIQSLEEEMSTWCDNLEGTPLENTSKYDAVRDCADTLGDLASRMEDIALPEECAYRDTSISYLWVHPYGHSIGRSWRAGQVIASLEAVAEAIHKTTPSDAEIVDDLQAIADELGGVDFPGMF